jgi:two-component system response regulator AtoC
MASSSDANPRPGDAPLRLTVVSASAFASYELPREGEVLIGRSDKSDVFIDDSTISRKHAVLRVGSALELEDLGSVNGTRVREQRLHAGEPVAIHAGESFYLGSALAIVQRARSAPERATADDLATHRANLDRSPPSRPPAPDDAPVVHDPAMLDLYAHIDRLAPGAISVLVVGETGVGKELVAERIHRSSPRRAKPFVRLNCAAFAEALLESELFGHERGAFTGAHQAKAGLLESAHGGTVFLDEVTEMPLGVQAKLLRVVEAKETTRVGALTPRAIDVRFVAATNRSLEEETENGRFRRDLYFRLNAAVIRVPPLRDRPSEVEPLARAFVSRACRDLSRPTASLGESALALLRRYPWPGNVRELKNFIERAVLIASGPELLAEHFPLEQMAASLPVHRWAEKRASVEADADPERERILRVLSECGGNQSRAAKALGIARSTLVARLESYGVPRPRKA